jgi:hypothetical protein
VLNLVLTTDKLQLVTSSAATVDVHASFADLSGSTVTPGKQNTATSSAATTDIVAAPAGSTVRNVKTLHIRNKDASLDVDVTIVFDANGTDYELHKATVGTGQSLEYIEGIGFFLIQATAKLDKMLYVTANSVHATAATFAVITGLTTPVISGKRYVFNCGLAAITAATTTGAQFGIGGVAMTDMVAMGRSVLLGSPTAASTNTTGVVTAINTAVMAQTTGAATNQPHEMSGSFQPSADGTFEIRATSETTTANGLTILKGSWAHIRETDN